PRGTTPKISPSFVCPPPRRPPRAVLRLVRSPGGGRKEDDGVSTTGGTRADRTPAVAGRTSPLALRLDPLLEREDELGVLRARIDGEAGRGRLIAIEAPPGVGKTSLILEARAPAQDARAQAPAPRSAQLGATVPA